MVITLVLTNEGGEDGDDDDNGDDFDPLYPDGRYHDGDEVHK